MDQVIPFNLIKHLWLSVPEHRCANCAKSFDTGIHLVEGYPHEGGWEIPGSIFVRWWLYVHCRCGYDTSFSKLGIDRKILPSTDIPV